MEILPWVNAGLGALVAVVCLMLYVDGRGRCKTVRALQERVVAQDVAIGVLSRALFLPLVESVEPALPPVEPMARAAFPSPVAPRSEPAPRQLADDDTLPSEGVSDDEIKAAIRARWEREADERDARRAMLPEPGEAQPVEPAPERASRPSDEPTQVFKGADRDAMLRGVKMRALAPGAAPPPRPVRSERPTTLEGVPTTVPKAPRAPRVAPLADASVERPVSSAKRAAQTWTAKPAAAILVAFKARLDASTAAGLDVSHCGGRDCNNDAEGVCSCGCAPCDRRRAHFSFAASEVRGKR
jgi:hypothetical protein